MQRMPQERDPEKANTPHGFSSVREEDGRQDRKPGHEGRTWVLSVSPFEEDHAFLRSIRGLGQWSIYEAHSRQEAIGFIGENQVCVVICESRLPDGDWKDLLPYVPQRVHPPYLIVTSRLADDRLWAEVLNLGGYDVLAKPFDAEEVSRVVGIACGVARPAPALH